MINYIKKKKWKKIIKKSGLFDSRFYLMNYPDVKTKDIDPISHYIKFGADEGRDPNSNFNTTWYLKQYPLVKKDKVNPLVHYILFGKNEKRRTKPLNNSAKVVKKSEDLQSILNREEFSDYCFLKEQNLNLKNYFKNISHNSSFKDPLLDFIKNWKEEEVVIQDLFDTKLYLKLYPDISTNPLVHYLRHGKKEGRLAFVKESDYTQQGRATYDSEQETIIFVSHESSATGAPLLGFNIVSSLNEKYNIIHIVLRKSKIHDLFKENCFLLIDDLEEDSYNVTKILIESIRKKYPLKLVLLNSVVTFPILKIAHELQLPSLSLIHEFADYIKPLGIMSKTIMFADRVVVPANIIKKSMLIDLKSQYHSYLNKPNNIRVFPQGKLPFLPESYGENDSKEALYNKFNITDIENTKIVVASGFFHIRKGVDIFISLCSYIKKNYPGECRFIWVGDGYNPSSDMGYSIWLKKDIECSGIEKKLFFLDHQKNLDVIFNIADIFCLTSRMDPFPNVVIDALEHNLPIALFREASGSVEFLENNDAEYLLADYLDTFSLAKKIAEYLKSNKKSSKNSNLVKERLSFKNYIEKIETEMEEILEKKREEKEIVEFIKNKNVFDSNFYGWSHDKEYALSKHVTLNLKGLHSMNPNPFPGFSQGIWREKNSYKEGVVPLYEALKEGQLSTHRCEIIPSCKESKSSIKFKYAIHLHLFYTDLSEFFCEYFSKLPGNFDLFITIVDRDEESFVKEVFRKCGAHHIEVVTVDNIGRDIGPMLFAIKEKLLTGNYEIVGHFHSKKSLSTDDKLGDRWRAYLMENLIGDKKSVNEILNLFNEPSIGLVFSEDSHNIDIGENLEFIHSLCEMLEIKKIDNTPIFPLGNMFWARLDAIKQLFTLKEELVLQNEPLPYDGSFMHSIERITPHIVQQNDYEFITVYKKGTKW